MDIVIRDIGNSKGVIIPANLLREAGIERTADMRLEDGHIILKAKAHPRADWLKAISNDPPQAEEETFMDGLEDAALLEEWTW